MHINWYKHDKLYIYILIAIKPQNKLNYKFTKRSIYKHGTVDIEYIGESVGTLFNFGHQRYL